MKLINDYVHAFICPQLYLKDEQNNLCKRLSMHSPYSVEQLQQLASGVTDWSICLQNS